MPIRALPKIIYEESSQLSSCLCSHSRLSPTKTILLSSRPSRCGNPGTSRYARASMKS